METDQGAAFAKLMGNPEGSQALFCEYIGTRAAAWLGLPTFDVAVVDVSESGIVRYANGSASHPGPAFVARFEEGTTWGGSSEELDAIENPEALAGLVVLDTWLMNCDRYRPDADYVRRNTRNVFLADGAGKGKFRILAMDHTHCFTCGQSLTKSIRNIDRVQDTRLYGHFPEFRAHVTQQAVRHFSQRLGSFPRSEAESIMREVPPLWRPASEVTSALLEFLCQRAGFVGQNVRQMLLDQHYLEPELELEG